MSNCTTKQRICLICALTIISIYFGRVSIDTALLGGKNLPHFILMYTIGDTIAKYRERIDRIKTCHILWTCLLLNISIVIFFAAFWFTPARSLKVLVDNDNGLILMINAFLTFILFQRIRLKSRLINSLAASVIVIYIVQQEPFLSEHLSALFTRIWEIPQMYSCHGLTDTLILVGYLACKAVFYMFAGIAINKIFTPLWKISSKLLKRLPSLNYEIIESR